jgi:Protein of unknown function (DUF2844)
MKRNLYMLFVGLGFSAVLFAAAQRAQATLGESSDSISYDKKVLSAVQRSTTTLNGYTVHEIDSAPTVIREYVSTSGIVFGIAWQGLIHPDLTRLLGSYAGEYQEALSQTPRIRGSRRLQVKSSGVIVEKWGHMRNLQGRAYVPSLIPPGVSVDEIK